MYGDGAQCIQLRSHLPFAAGGRINAFNITKQSKVWTLASQINLSSGVRIDCMTRKKYTSSQLGRIGTAHLSLDPGLAHMSKRGTHPKGILSILAWKTVISAGDSLLSLLNFGATSVQRNDDEVHRLLEQDYDLQGEYIRKWVPELARVPQPHIHEPWKMPSDAAHQVGSNALPPPNISSSPFSSPLCSPTTVFPSGHGHVYTVRASLQRNWLLRPTHLRSHIRHCLDFA